VIFRFYYTCGDIWSTQWNINRNTHTHTLSTSSVWGPVNQCNSPQLALIPVTVCCPHPWCCASVKPSSAVQTRSETGQWERGCPLKHQTNSQTSEDFPQGGPHFNVNVLWKRQTWHFKLCTYTWLNNKTRWDMSHKHSKASHRFLSCE